jgi:hypothetical protein
MSDCLNRYWHQFLASLPAEAERPLGFGEPIAFGFTAKDATEISKLVLDQIKTATGSVLWSYEADGKALPQMGDFCSPQFPEWQDRGVEQHVWCRHHGKFIDSTIPSTFAPFGIHNINGQLWVTYAKQDTHKHDPVVGAGRGFVDVFDTDGNLLRHFATRGVLNAPWGVVLAPAHFGQFGNDILIGNFGDGKISAWDLRTRDFIDWLRNGQGKVIKLGTLWDLVFGGGLNASPQILYFTTGLVNEQDGLFGTLTLQ